MFAPRCVDKAWGVRHDSRKPQGLLGSCLTDHHHTSISPSIPPPCNQCSGSVVSSAHAVMQPAATNGGAGDGVAGCETGTGRWCCSCLFVCVWWYCVGPLPVWSLCMAPCMPTRMDRKSWEWSRGVSSWCKHNILTTRQLKRKIEHRRCLEKGEQPQMLGWSNML